VDDPARQHDLCSEVGPLTRPSQRTVEPILCAVLR
jgi:hypothetical protein